MLRRLGAMVLLCLLCLVSVCAPQPCGESDGGAMSRTPRVINADPTGFNPNGAGVGPGDVVVDFSGVTPRVGVVVRASALVNTIALLVVDQALFSSTVWAPGAGGSGDGVLSGSVLSTLSGLAVSAEVEVTLTSTAAINAVGVGVGSPRLVIVSGTQAIIRVQTTVGGLWSLSIDGTAAADLTWVARIIVPSSIGTDSGTEVLP